MKTNKQAGTLRDGVLGIFYVLTVNIFSKLEGEFQWARLLMTRGPWWPDVGLECLKCQEA